MEVKTQEDIALWCLEKKGSAASLFFTTTPTTICS